MTTEEFDRNGYLPLHRAAMIHDRARIQSLLAEGARVDARDQFEATALIMAADELPTVDLLLAHGADPNLQDKNGSTALHMAGMVGQRDVAIRLLQAGARVDLRDVHGRTAPDHTRQWEFDDLADFMLNYAAAVDAKKIIDNPELASNTSTRPL